MSTRVKAVIYGLVVGALFVASAVWSLSQMLGGDELQLIASNSACIFMFIVATIPISITIIVVVDDAFVTDSISRTIIIFVVVIVSKASSIIGGVIAIVIFGSVVVIGKRLYLKKASDWAAVVLSMCLVIALSAIVATIVAINSRGSADVPSTVFCQLPIAIVCLVVTIAMAYITLKDRKE